MKVFRTCFALALALLPVFQARSAVREWIVYVGTYTRQTSKGIYAYRFEGATGKLTPIGLAVETSNPSFLAVHPNQRFVYAVGEGSTGITSAFAIEPGTGKLKLLNSVSSKGNGPCHVAFDKTGKWIFVANYGSGSIAAFPVRADGTLGEASASIQHSGSSVDTRRQEGPHAHSVNISPDNRFLVATDLGLDETLVYRFDLSKGALTPNDPPFAKSAAGLGPRHFTFSPNGKFAYVVNEMKSSVTAFSYDKSRGTLKEIQTLSALPDNFSGSNSGAEIVIHPDGQFLYSSNRGHDSIAVFGVDPKSGLLKPSTWIATGGKTPRSFAIDPTGRYLFAANQNSDSVVVFRIDQTTGGLRATGGVLEVPSPVSVVFAAAK